MFNNGLTPLPDDTPLYQYQRLARSGQLWFYDDHQQVIDVLPSHLPHKPGFLGLVYNRDTGTVTSTHYKFLGRAFLTTPEALKAPIVFTDEEITAIAWLRASGFVLPVLYPEDTVGVSDDTLNLFEEAVEATLPQALVNFTQK